MPELTGKGKTIPVMPEWMKKEDSYDPPSGGSRFLLKTIRSLGGILSRLRTQTGQEKGKRLPALPKFLILLALIVSISLVQNRLILLAFAAFFFVLLCILPARTMAGVLKSALFAAALTFVIMLPAIILHPAGRVNNLIVVGKVFVCVGLVNIFNHTTQWNHITTALRTIHIPGIFVFILDITLKYLVLLGKLIRDLLTACSLRSVGRNKKKYQSVGGVMGVTFVRSTQMSQQMYEAMQCRGFTDDYKGL